MFKKIAILVAILCICTTAYAQEIVKVFESGAIEQGTTVENAVIVFGDLSVDGRVKEAAVVIGGDLNVGPTGQVDGDTVVVFGKLNKEPGAAVLGKTVELSFGKWCSRSNVTKHYALPALGILTVGLVGFLAIAGFLAIFLLIAILFTDKVGRASYYSELHPWRALYHGFIIAVLIIPVTLFLIVSIVGIPIVPLLFIVLSAATLFGYAAVCQLIGLKFLKAIKMSGKPMVIEVIVGFIILTIIAFIPVAGWFVKTLAWLVGLGATVDTRFGTVQKTK